MNELGKQKNLQMTKISKETPVWHGSALQFWKQKDKNGKLQFKGKQIKSNIRDFWLKRAVDSYLPKQVADSL